MCGLSLLSWYLIIRAGRNIQNILATFTVLLLDVTCVGAIFSGRPSPPVALSCDRFEAGPKTMRPNLALVPYTHLVICLQTPLFHHHLYYSYNTCMFPHPGLWNSPQSTCLLLPVFVERKLVVNPAYWLLSGYQTL